jgi:dTDP-4-dehydrorhamnose reductase
LSLPERIAVSGATGRLGRALVSSLLERTTSVIPWNRHDYDLDDPGSAVRVVERDHPEMVIHCAAWTDVDGCARDPGLAQRRNADAVGELALATAAAGARLVLLSTNEVFDGRRMDRIGYSEADPTNPINPYGTSKAAGEVQARAAFESALSADMLWIVRTQWLYGAPGGDFPAKIVAAADRLEAGESLRVVTDEIGSPTWTEHLAPALLDLVAAAPGATYHLASPASVSRFEWAGAVIEICRPGTPLESITSAEFARASTPPAWGVLDTAKAAKFGVRLGDWRESLEKYAKKGC